MGAGAAARNLGIDDRRLLGLLEEDGGRSGDDDLGDDVDLDEVDAFVRAELGDDTFESLSEAELHEVRLKVIKTKIVRGAAKVKARLYRLAHKAKAKLAKMKWMRKGGKRLKRIWKRIMRSKKGLLSRLKGRFGKRTRVMLAQGYEHEGTSLREDVAAIVRGDGGSVGGTKLEDADVRSSAMCLGADVACRIGLRLAEAEDVENAQAMADLAEKLVELSDRVDVGAVAEEECDAKARPLVSGIRKAIEFYESDEFWERYAERGPFSVFSEGDAEAEDASDDDED